MSNDVLITPASRKIEFKDSSANVDAKIETDSSGNLIITNPGGDISIGDTTADIFVGDGTNNIDIVFEQDGEIRGTSGVTVTLGASGSNVRMATDLNINNNNITNVNDLTVAGNLTVSGTTTTVSSTNTTIADSLLELNSGLTGTNSKDIGLIFERGSTGNNAAFFWDESGTRFRFVTTTDTGSSTTISSNISEGTVQAGSFIGNGSQLSSLNATNIATGTINTARLPNPIHLSGGNAIIKLQETDVTNSPTWWHVADGGNYSIRLNNTGAYPISIQTDSDNDAVTEIDLNYTVHLNSQKLQFGGESTSYIQNVNKQSTDVWRFQTEDGRIDIGSENSSWAHFSTDRPSFYFGNKVTVDGNVEPYTDSTRDLGANTLRWANVYADTLHGDGSNITGITATDSTKLPLAGGTMTGGINMNGGRLSNVFSLQLRNGELTDFNGTRQMIIDANDSDTNVPSHGSYAGSAPFGIYFTGDNDASTTTLGSGLVKVWHTGHFSKSHIDYFVGLQGTGVTTTEFDYLDGVTSNIQTQLNSKISDITTQTDPKYLRSNANDTATGDINFARASFGSSSLHSTGGSHGVVTDSFSLHSGASDLMYMRPSALRSDNGFFQWQTYNGGNGGDIELQPYGGSVTISTGSATNASGNGLRFQTGSGSYSDGRYQHRFRKRDEGGGIPLYLDQSDGTANSFTAIARFGNYTNNAEKFAVFGDAKVTGNLNIGADDTTPQISMLFDDHASGGGWDTRIEIGKSDDLTAGTGVFPTYVPSGAYGMQVQANSDGVFFGMEEYSTGNFRPIIQWGDDDTDTPFRIKHENGSEFTVSYNGIATATTRLSAPQVYATVANGTSPLVITSTTLVSNLNADRLDGQHGSHYLDYNNFTNTPTIPSLSGYATESYVTTQVNNLIDSAPGALNTLNELAAAIGDDANFSTTVTNSIATKLPLAGGTLTGNLTIGSTTDSTKIVFPDKNVPDNPTAASNDRQLISMGNSGAGGLFQTTGRGGLMLASADDSVIIASGDVGRNYDPDAGGYHPNADDEEIYLLTDGGVRFMTNLQNAASYKQFIFDNSGNATIPGNITVSGTVDGVDIAARNSVLTTTTTTANAALPKSGGTMTGAVTMAGQTWNGDITWNNGKNILVGGESSIDVSGSGYFQIWDAGTGAPFIKCDVGVRTEIGNAGSRGLLVYGEMESSSLDVNGGADISGALNVGGNLTIADQIRIGDDAWLEDYNVANSVRVKGNQNNNLGFIAFGQQTASLGCNGTSTLEYNNNNLIDTQGALYSGNRKFISIEENTSNTERGPWNPMVTSIRNSGRRLHADEDFRDGSNGVGVYNNSGGGTVAHFREDATTNSGGAAPNSSGKVIRIYYNGGTASPGFGGFVQNIPSEDNHTFVQIFQAKLPTGKSLNIAENAQGSNNRSYFLTDNIGTGKWEWYARVSHCGNSGTFSSGGHIYVSGGSGAFTWYLASCTVIDVTEPVMGETSFFGNIVLEGDPTTSNQDRMIDFTGYDKEGTTDFSDRAFIRHTTNTGGHSGSVLLISSQNDANDGIAFHTNGSSYLKHNSNNVFTDAYHPNADAWTTSRTITLGGDLSGSVSINGSSNVTLTATVADDSHNHVISNVDGLQSALDGKMSTSGGTFSGAVTVNANMDFSSTDTAARYIHMPRGGGITFYGDTSQHHGIFSRNQANASADDLLISSYGAVYIDLDSNNNNTSGSDFFIGRHNQSSGSQSAIFAVRSETGNIVMNSLTTISQSSGTLTIGDIDQNDDISTVELNTMAGNGRLVVGDGEIFMYGNQNSNAEFKFTSNGILHCDNDVIAFSSTISSDRKLKENIQPIEGGLNKILKLKGVSFDWKDEKKGNNQLGFIAQEVEEVLPELVKEVETLGTEDETHKVVNYDGVIPVLVEAIKMQQKQIDRLSKLLEDK